MSKQVLGRGLEALIPPREKTQSVTEIEISKIRTNPQQPRKNFQPEKMGELVSSIKKHGVIQPVIVRAKGDLFEVIAGERRLRAAQEAGLEKVPAVIRSATDEKSLELALIENIQREDLNPIEEARAYTRLITEFGLTQEDAADQVGKSRVSVTNSLRLLRLPQEIQNWIEEGRLSQGHAKAVLAIHDSNIQIKIAKEILSLGLSVRQTEEKVERLAHKSGIKNKKRNPKDPFIFNVEEKLKDSFSTMVYIKDKGKKGQIIIEYFSREELQRIIDQLIPSGLDS